LSGWTLFKMAIGPSMFSRAMAMASHGSRTLVDVTSSSESAVIRSKAARASASICRQAASRVTASRTGSVTRDTKPPRRSAERAGGGIMACIAGREVASMRLTPIIAALVSIVLGGVRAEQLPDATKKIVMVTAEGCVDGRSLRMARPGGIEDADLIVQPVYR